MWDKTTFDEKAIDKELAFAESIGLSCVRCVLQYAVHKDNPDYFLKTFDQFLAIYDKHKIRAMPIFFDDCVFSPYQYPKVGKQPEPLIG